MKIIDGKAISEKILGELKTEVELRKNSGRKIPHLAAVLVGDNPASSTYVNAKIKACNYTGFKSTLLKLSEDITQAELLETISKLNSDSDIDGFIVQLPLPSHIDENLITKSIDPTKDVDGFHPTNLGKMVLNKETFLPATPFGIIKLLQEYNISTTGKHCVVIGRSNIVGTPMSLLMSRNEKFGNCTVTLCHSKTENLELYTQSADIIIAAIGKPLFLKSHMIKQGSVIIDVGINRIESSATKSGFKLVGDVDFESVKNKCSLITPVPGGVGPMTIAALMCNTLKATT